MVWLPAVLAHLQRGADLGDRAPLLFLGSFGPLAAALIVAAGSGGADGIRLWWKALTRWRVGLGWYALALYGFPALGLLAILVLGASDLKAVLAEISRMLLLVPANALMKDATV